MPWLYWICIYWKSHQRPDKGWLGKPRPAELLSHCLQLRRERLLINTFVKFGQCFKNCFWSSPFFLSVVRGTEVDFLIAYPAQRWTILPFLLSLCSLCENQSRPSVQVHCINLDAQSVYGLSKLSTGKERDVKTKIKCSRNQSPRTFSQVSQFKVVDMFGLRRWGKRDAKVVTSLPILVVAITQPRH